MTETDGVTQSVKAIKSNRYEELKVPPHSLEAEQSVLGGLMIDGNSWDKVSELISENDFYRQEHRLLFRTLTDLSRRNLPFDVITIADALKNTKQLEAIGGEVYIFSLAKNTPTASNIAAYAEIVRERSILRQLVGASYEIVNLAFNTNGQSSKAILDLAENLIYKIGEERTRGQGPIDITSLLAKATDRIDTLFHSEASITGLPTGFNDLDEMTSGFHSGDLIIIAGRPSMGKTSLAMNIVEHAIIKAKQPTLVFSMEMPGESLAMRMLSSLGRIDQHKVRTGKLHDQDWPRLTSTVSLLAEAELYVDDTSSLSPAEIRSRTRRLAKTIKQPLGLIVIDYLQLMQIPGFKENRTTEITEISRSLKALAKEFNVPVIALSQLNRSLEQRSDRRPQMSDLRESGAIEQDADIILFIYRDEVYNEASQDKGIAEIIIAKQRNGPIGKIRLTFLGEYTRFENYTFVNYQASN